MSFWSFIKRRGLAPLLTRAGRDRDVKSREELIKHEVPPSLHFGTVQRVGGHSSSALGA